MNKIETVYFRFTINNENNEFKKSYISFLTSIFHDLSRILKFRYQLLRYMRLFRHSIQKRYAHPIHITCSLYFPPLTISTCPRDLISFAFGWIIQIRLHCRCRCGMHIHICEHNPQPHENLGRVKIRSSTISSSSNRAVAGRRHRCRSLCGFICLPALVRVGGGGGHCWRTRFV